MESPILPIGYPKFLTTEVETVLFNCVVFCVFFPHRNLETLSASKILQRQSTAKFCVSADSVVQSFITHCDIVHFSLLHSVYKLNKYMIV